MKNVIKKITTITLALLIAISAFAVSAFAITDPIKDTTKDVKFTIHKYDVPADGTYTFPEGNGTELSGSAIPTFPGLEGVTFTAYKITDNSKSTEIPIGGTVAFTMTTGSNGLATKTIAAADQGTYLFVETKVPEKVTQRTPNFVVDLPMTNPDLTTWNYNVHVYPKNYTVLGAVVLTKTADNGPMPAGKTATFKLQQQVNGVFTDMPSYTALVTNAQGKIAVNNLIVGNYRFIETVAPEGYGLNNTPITFAITKNGSVAPTDFSLVTGTVEQVSFNNSGEPVISKEISADGINFGTEVGQDMKTPVTFKLSPTIPKDIGTENYKKFIVTDVINSKLTFAGLDSVAVKVGAKTLVKGTDYTAAYDVATHTLKVIFVDNGFIGGKTALLGAASADITFNATINDTAIMGENIPNKATLIFNNGFTADKSTESVETNVHTGGVKFLKVDAQDNTKLLQGAEFAIYATKADADAKKNPIATATSDATGKFEFKGLAYGNLNDANATAKTTYYVVETKAVKGYNLLGTILEVEVNAKSYELTNTITVTNAKQPDLPITGGVGTTLFTIIGFALIGGAVLMFVKYKKSSNKA